jgi:hypothetical protein
LIKKIEKAVKVHDTR